VSKVSEKLAQRYARALFDLTDSGQLDQLRPALDTLAAVWRTQSALRDVLSNPHIPAAEKREVLRALAQKTAAAGEHLERFLFLLLENGRLNALPAIAKAFADLVRKSRNIRALEVVSASQLDDAERAALANQLAQRLQSQLEINWLVRPEIVGGLQIKEGDRLLDGSLAGRLERARKALAQ
jgi:F-type H+-transporting ATPase subunit delta